MCLCVRVSVTQAVTAAHKDLYSCVHRVTDLLMNSDHNQNEVSLTYFSGQNIQTMQKWTRVGIFRARCVRRTNRRVIAMMFVRLSVCLFVCSSLCLGRACRPIVIIRCILTRI